jgi:hypothetical protein
VQAIPGDRQRLQSFRTLRPESKKAVLLAHGFSHTGEMANTNLEIEWLCATHS